MREYFKNNLPRLSLILIAIFFIFNILTLIFQKLGNILFLYPSNLHEPWNWYRFVTYPLYAGGLIKWFLSSLSFLFLGYLIEHRIKKSDLIGLIIISSVIGGLVFTIINQNDSYNIPIASPTMISWGYWAAGMVIGIKFLKELSTIEKTILILYALSIFSIEAQDKGFLVGQIIVIITIAILSFIKVKKK
ncbi:MAG: rhomboid family intramembrane serine protease [Bacteroidales bacterium]